MTISTFSTIMGRIQAATPDSPIAVFSLPSRNDMVLDAVFGSTVATKARIEQRDPLYVGSFHRGMNQDSVRLRLNTAMLKAVLTAA